MSVIICIQLDDNFQEYYTEIYGKPASKNVLIHMKREIVHEIWHFLMDDDFMHAFIHGLVFKFLDGIMRIMFPQTSIYRSDYPEKWEVCSLMSLTILS